MVNSQPSISPKVGAYIEQEIVRRTQYKVKLENTPKYIGYDDFTEMNNEQERASLKANMDNLAQDIFRIARRHLPDVEIIPGEDELSIANILAALPEPEQTQNIRVISSRLGAPG